VFTFFSFGSSFVADHVTHSDLELSSLHGQHSATPLSKEYEIEGLCEPSKMSWLSMMEQLM